MSIESTGRSKTEQPSKPARLQRVIRLHALGPYLGVTRSVIQELVKQGKLHPFSITGQRAKVVTEAEVIELQTKAQAEAKAKRNQDD
jgi:hypothetical protein